MNDVDRGMVKYAPFQSLTAQAESLAKMKAKRNHKPKPQISADRIEEINSYLSGYSGQDATLTYWVDGDLRKLVGKIRKIDTNCRKIYLGPIGIDFSNIIDIE